MRAVVSFKYSALEIFLYKLRHVSSNASIAAIFKLDREEQVSDVIDSTVNTFVQDILAFKFGFNARSRTDLIENETSVFARKIYGA